MKLISLIKRKAYNAFHPAIGQILMFHRVTDHTDELSVTPNRLRTILQQYKNDGYHFATLTEIEQSITNSKKRKLLCLTFDDGYLDTMNCALPILKEFNAPFCVYVTTNYYTKKELPWWDITAEMMNNEQLLRLSKEPLCTIGGHTMSHPHLSCLNLEQQRNEIINNKKHIESLLGKQIEHFAYPHGDYSEDSIKIVEEAGYKTAVTCSGRSVRHGSIPFELGRLLAK